MRDMDEISTDGRREITEDSGHQAVRKRETACSNLARHDLRKVHHHGSIVETIDER